VTATRGRVNLPGKRRTAEDAFRGPPASRCAWFIPIGSKLQGDRARAQKLCDCWWWWWIAGGVGERLAYGMRQADAKVAGGRVDGWTAVKA